MCRLQSIRSTSVKSGDCLQSILSQILKVEIFYNQHFQRYSKVRIFCNQHLPKGQKKALISKYANFRIETCQLSCKNQATFAF